MKNIHTLNTLSGGTPPGLSQSSPEDYDYPYYSKAHGFDFQAPLFPLVNSFPDDRISLMNRAIPQLKDTERQMKEIHVGKNGTKEQRR